MRTQGVKKVREGSLQLGTQRNLEHTTHILRVSSILFIRVFCATGMLWSRSAATLFQLAERPRFREATVASFWFVGTPGIGNTLGVGLTSVKLLE